MSLISSLDTTFRKAKEDLQVSIILFQSVLDAIRVWEINTRLTSGIVSLQVVQNGVLVLDGQDKCLQCLLRCLT